MNILLEGIIRLEPADTELHDSRTSRSLDSFLNLADTELQSSRLQTKNSLGNLKSVRGGGGGGGGGGFVDSQTSRPLDSLV